MRFVALTLQNFRQHADSVIHFPPRGVTGIVGSNGGGKSTILEGASWALFGAAAARGTKSGLRWKRATARRQAAATLTFDVRGERYRVERTESNATVFLDATNAVVAAGTAAVNDYIPRLVGMSLDEFQATYMCQQKDLARLASMTPMERRQLLRDVMGVGRIDRALEACRRRKNQLATERDGLAAGLGAREPLVQEFADASEAVTEASETRAFADSQVNYTRHQLDSAREAFDASRKQQQEHDTAVQRANAAVQNADAALAESRALQKQIDDAHAARAYLLEHETQLSALPGLRSERDQLRAAASAASERTTLQNTITASTHDVTEYSKYVADADAAIAAFDAEEWQRVKDAFRIADARYRMLGAERQQKAFGAVARKKTAIDDLARAKKRLSDVETRGPDGECPTCAHRLGSAFAGLRADLAAEVDRLCDVIVHADNDVANAQEASDEEIALEVQLDELKERGEQLRTLETNHKQAVEHRPTWERNLTMARERLQEASDRIRTIPQASADPTRLAFVLDEITRLEKLDESLGDKRAMWGRVDVLQEQLALVQRRHADAVAHMEQARDAIISIDFDQAKHDELEDALRKATDAVADARAARARAEEALEQSQTRLDRARAARARYDERGEQLTQLVSQVKLHELAAERLDAFRRAQADSIRPELEQLTSGLVSILTDGRHESVTITDSFDVELQESGVAMEVVSGGTEDIAAIAMRIAISQMIAQRAGHPLSLLVLDEPFGSLDAVRRGNVLALLRHLADVFEQVLLISHVEETRDSVDHVIEVTHSEAAGCCSVRCSFVHDTPRVLEGAAA